MIKNTEFGRIDISTVPLPAGLGSNVSGTYTCSGRVLVSANLPEKDKDWYRVFTMEDDGTGIREVFAGIIPQKPGANGIRWMCFSDNRRVLLGDYVLEASPDLDHAVSASVVDLFLPEEISRIPGVFMRWSEPIIAPDNEHIVFSTLTGGSSYNVLGRLVRDVDAYRVEDACLISSLDSLSPDPDEPGWFRQGVLRGGEVKQFVRGGRGITLAGGGKSVSESALQMLDSEEYAFITDTLGYEETAILSPDEVLAICMSPRFSPATDMGVLGVVPLSGDLLTRGRYLNVLYQYAISGIRHFRSGNIGPALIDVGRSMREGRQYRGVDLSDPEDRFVYYSPMSWHPDSTRAMWNERTRLNAGPVECRLRVARLLDRAAAEPVKPQHTPDRGEIPYAEPLSRALEVHAPVFPLCIKGAEGYVENVCPQPGTTETRYHHFSEDGQTYYDGFIRVTAPENMFRPGKTVITGDISVTGAHTGRMDLTLCLQADERFQIHPVMAPGEDGLPQCRGYAEYDGLRRNVSDISL